MLQATAALKARLGGRQADAAAAVQVRDGIVESARLQA
jgi:hypothetical protein